MSQNKDKIRGINSSESEAEKDFVSDSLSAYMRNLHDSQTLSPEEEFNLMKKYNDVIDLAWKELCKMEFVANEYLNLLQDISSANICDNFFILRLLRNKSSHPDSLLPEFYKWKEDIAALYAKCNSPEPRSSCIKYKKLLANLLQKFRPQNSFIHEWIEVADEYKKELIKLNPRTKKQKAQHILNRIMLDEKEFLSIMDKLEKYREIINSIRKEILEANLKLVFSIAKRYDREGISVNDLIQEGNIGLIKALDKFDYTLGNKFSTYATWWVKQYVSRAVAEQTRTIRIPFHMLATINRINAEEQIFIQEKGREPSSEELAAILEMPLERVRALQRMASQTISLQTPVGDEGDSSLADMIEDENSEDPVKKAAYSLLKEKINQALDMLSERERQILTMRFGLADDDEQTLDEIAKRFNITRERVRQIEAKAIEKLRHPSRRKHLEGYF